ncbi:MAG: aminotransferase class V-fold PLP-dependent enzyme [Planctomycetota bacterium]
MNFSTKLIAFDACPDDPFRPTATPIYQTATFEQESALEFGRFDYSRSGNPTRKVLEDLVAELECGGVAGGGRSFAFASGLAAITAVTRLLNPGDEIVAADDLYGGTYRLFTKLLQPKGIAVRFEDFTKPETIKLSPKTKLVYFESPSNPLLQVFDIRKIVELAKTVGALVCVDGTATTPYVQRPIELGADIVLHSATKYLSGHADVTAGVVSVKSGPIADQIGFIQNAEGAGLGPQDSYLLLRGIKTLSLRLDRQQASAQEIAEWLKVSLPAQTGRRVYFPGLRTHPGYELHRSQALGPGAVLSFETGDVDVSRKIVEGLRLFKTAVSFGAVGSSASLPCCMSHKPITKDGGSVSREAKCLPPDLVRLSVGIEDVRDLIADLRQAIERATVKVETPTPRAQVARV